MDTDKQKAILCQRTLDINLWLESFRVWVFGSASLLPRGLSHTVSHFAADKPKSKHLVGLKKVTISMLSSGNQICKEIVNIWRAMLPPASVCSKPFYLRQFSTLFFLHVCLNVSYFLDCKLVWVRHHKERCSGFKSDVSVEDKTLVSTLWVTMMPTHDTLRDRDTFLRAIEQSTSTSSSKRQWRQQV